MSEPLIPETQGPARGRRCRSCKAIESSHDAYLAAWSKPHHDFDPVVLEDDLWWELLCQQASQRIKALLRDYPDAFTIGERRDLEHALIIIEERNG